MARVQRAVEAARVRENSVACRILLGLLCLVVAPPLTLIVLLQLTLGLRSEVFGTMFMRSAVPYGLVSGMALVAVVVLGLGGLALAIFCVRIGDRWWSIFRWMVASYVGILVLAAALVALT